MGQILGQQAGPTTVQGVVVCVQGCSVACQPLALAYPTSTCRLRWHSFESNMDPKAFLVVAEKFIVAQIGSTGLKPYSIVVTSTLAWCSRDSRLTLLLVLLGLLLLLIAGCVVLMWRHHGNDKDGGNIIIAQPANVTGRRGRWWQHYSYSVFYQQRRLLTMIPLQRMLQRMRRSRLVVAHAPVGSWRVQVASTHAKLGSGAAAAAADSFQSTARYSTVSMHRTKVRVF